MWQQLQYYNCQPRTWISVANRSLARSILFLRIYYLLLSQEVAYLFLASNRIHFTIFFFFLYEENKFNWDWAQSIYFCQKECKTIQKFWKMKWYPFTFSNREYRQQKYHLLKPLGHLSSNNKSSKNNFYIQQIYNQRKGANFKIKKKKLFK